MGKPKTKARKSCPSGRAFARGKKKGRCVPKGHRRKGCYAHTREEGIRKLRTYRKRLHAATRATKAESTARAAAEKEMYTPSKSWFQGLGGRRRRRRRHR